MFDGLSFCANVNKLDAKNWAIVNILIKLVTNRLYWKTTRIQNNLAVFVATATAAAIAEKIWNFKRHRRLLQITSVQQ